jgi:DNA-binding GntR family transcriptional regulator
MISKRQTPAGGPRVLLRQRAYGELKELIQSGALPAGAFLSERQLVGRLGMSKTPIRAALQQLEGEGLVSVSPQQGILVRELSAREILELFDLRAAVEPFVARRLAGKLRPEQAAALEANLRAQEEAARQVDAVRTAALDARFHLLLAEALDNREIVRLLQGALNRLFREIVRISRSAEGRLFASYREHAGVVEAVCAADAEAAARRMEEHLRFGKQFLLNG